MAKQRPKNMRNALAHSNGKCERKVSPALLFGWCWSSWLISSTLDTLSFSYFCKISRNFSKMKDFGLLQLEEKAFGLEMKTSHLMRNLGIFIANRNFTQISANITKPKVWMSPLDSKLKACANSDLQTVNAQDTPMPPPRKWMKCALGIEGTISSWKCSKMLTWGQEKLVPTVTYKL